MIWWRSGDGYLHALPKVNHHRNRKQESPDNWRPFVGSIDPQTTIDFKMVSADGQV